MRGGVESVRRGPVVAPVGFPLEFSVHAPFVHLVEPKEDHKKQKKIKKSVALVGSRLLYKHLVCDVQQQ